MLDRDRPLWKGIVLRGIPGHTAVVWKIHHAMVDGVSGVDLTMVSPERQSRRLDELPAPSGRALGGTVNDVVLTMLAGGLGRYLRARGQNTGGARTPRHVPGQHAAGGRTRSARQPWSRT